MLRTLVALAMLCLPAAARDLGQWDEVDPATVYWFSHLMQPDTANPEISCCGESDAYWADEQNVTADGTVIATITDDRDDVKLGRAHVPVGTRYVIPPNKILNKGGNPTGHVIIFLGSVVWFNGENEPGKRAVLCFVLNGGV